MNDTLNLDNTPPPAGAMAEGAEPLLRRPIYIPAGDTTIFGWLHHAARATIKNCVAIICPPLGYEYTHSHRSVRHLADHLAECGITALRFDYRGTGDSPGSDTDSDRVSGWQRDIEAAIDYAKQTTGCAAVCVVGIRLGATLAALVAQQFAVNFLVLWNPCISGRRYLREMQAIAASAASVTGEQHGVIESAGFAMTRATAEQIGKIDLLTQATAVGARTLIVNRDDMGEDPRLAEKLRAGGTHVDAITLPGYAAMMAEPQFTIVPKAAIAGITRWLSELTANGSTPTRLAADSTDTVHFDAPAPSANDTRLTEQLCQFGADDGLFGILSFLHTRTSDKPTVVLLNSGSVHHVGPNRLYVSLSRALSTLGYTCLRFDLEGLGDSVLQGAGRENHPYPESAIRDVDSCLQYLKKQFGCSRFVLLGLCSGAHTAFHAGVELAEHDILDIISINPLTFHFVEGMSLETTQHFQDVFYYKNSARNIKSWIKLLRGKVNIAYIIGVAHSQLKIAIKSALQSLRERLFSAASTPLADDLKRLIRQNRPLSLFIAEHDPGYALLISGARYTATKAIKSGAIRLQLIPGADHTFSALAPRTILIERICMHLEGQFGSSK